MSSDKTKPTNANETSSPSYLSSDEFTPYAKTSQKLLYDNSCTKNTGTPAQSRRTLNLNKNSKRSYYNYGRVAYDKQVSRTSKGKPSKLLSKNKVSHKIVDFYILYLTISSHNISYSVKENSKPIRRPYLHRMMNLMNF